MKRILVLAATAVAAVAVVPVAAADNDPFPATKAGSVFVSAQTVNPSGAMSSAFAPGSTVVFRAYAVNTKTHKVITPKDVRFFYVAIPNQANVKLTYSPKAAVASGLYLWSGTWQVPATQPSGIVPFKVLVKTTSKLLGSFVQMPVATAMLNITASPQSPLGTGPAAAPAAVPSTMQLALYNDSINGSRPVGAAPRTVGCTQTNVYRRGEQLVLRAWGFDLSDGAVLSNDNVASAHYTVPGVSAPIDLQWGTHGAVGSKVYFWTNFWNIPKDFPLGDVTIQITFTTVSGKTATIPYTITIVP